LNATRRWPVLLLLFLAAGCGFLGDKGQEPKGDLFLPAGGVGKFLKQDFYCDAEFVQPFFPNLEDPATQHRLSGEPCMVVQDSAIRIWLERRNLDETGGSRIYTTLLGFGPGTGCRDVDAWQAGLLREIVFDPDPGPRVGAPTVLRANGLYRMWFTQGEGASIRYAFAEDADCTPADCHAWKLQPDAALVPNQDWERGTVGSPTVVYTAVHNLAHRVGAGVSLYLMYYDGDVHGDRAIGYAWSQDGITWTKADAQGNEAQGGVPAPDSGNVQPVLQATQTNWEFWYPDPSYGRDFVGRVGQPCVIEHRSPLRTLLLMYYTGNLAGSLQRPENPLNSRGRDASIGIAYSQDGVHWEKAPSYSTPEVIAMEINPIMAEKLAIVIDPDKPEGSVNVFSEFFLINEAAPAVLELVPNQFFVMLWEQTDYVNLHLAADLAVPPAPVSGYTGSSGIGFAYTGNHPF